MPSHRAFWYALPSVSMMSDSGTLHLSPVTARRFFGRITLALIALHVVSLALRLLGYGNTLGIPRLFDLDMEMSVPALFSTMLLLLNAVLFQLIAHEENHAARKSGMFSLLALAFVFLAIDESCQIHENLNLPLEQLLPSLSQANIAWFVPYAVVLALLAMVLLPFLRQLPAPFAKHVLGAGAVYLGGAVVVEWVGALYRGSMNTQFGDLYEYRLDWKDGLLVALEEGMEMAGLVLLLYTLLQFLGRNGIGVSVQLRED